MQDGQAEQLTAEIETAAYFGSLLPNGIARLVVKPGASITIQSIDEINDAFQRAGAVFPVATLCDISAPHQTTDAARKYAQTDEIAATTKKLALLVTSPVARMAGNIFLLFRRNVYESRLFTDESEAQAWLLED